MTNRRLHFFIALTLILGAGYTATRMMGQVSSTCGNTIVDRGEQCDDGNTDDTDGCTRSCRKAVPASVTELMPSATYLKDAWNDQLVNPSGLLSVRSGMTYNPSLRRWSPIAGWTGTGLTAQHAYFLSYATEAGVNIAEATQDREVIESLAQFYMDYFQYRFTTLDGMRAEVRAHSTEMSGEALGLNADGTLRANAEAGTFRTLPWYYNSLTVTPTQPYKWMPRECSLCMFQFGISPARLIRVISTLPASAQTAPMRNFAMLYSDILANDQVNRPGYLPYYQVRMQQTIAKVLAGIDVNASDGPSDTDLMRLSIISDLLAARTHNAALINMSDDTASTLRTFLTLGSELLRLRRTIHTDTKNWSGETVGSMDLMEGDYDDHSEFRYANYSGTSVSGVAPQPGTDVGYDISHAWRFPQAMRSLYDNKDVLGLNFPTADDMRLLANQFTYRVFKGDPLRPLLSNYMDGRDTWFRVGYSGSFVGYPPTQYCYAYDSAGQNRASTLPCLSTFNSWMAWGRLAEFQPDLGRVLSAVLDLTQATDAATVSFRDRYFTFGREAFVFNGQPIGTTTGTSRYSIAPLAYMSDLAISGVHTPLHSSAPEDPANPTVPNDNSQISACHAQAFTQDASTCITRLMEQSDPATPLVIHLTSGTYSYTPESIPLFLRKNVTLMGPEGAGPNVVTLRKLSSSKWRFNDLDFMNTTFGGTNLKLVRITLQ